MGTMLQAADLDLDDFQGHEGCNEILNVTRPDVVRDVHEAYLRVGCDAVETNTFGANLANLGEYGISDRIHELSLAAARALVAGVDSVRAAGPGGRRRLVHAGPAAVCARVGRSRYQAAHARACAVRHPA